MSKKLARREVPALHGLRRNNTITFPRELRNAIPDLPTYVGRVLKLDSINGRASNTRLFGSRVHLKLVAQETGKLKGEFLIRIDLAPEAARALAATLTQLADQAEPSQP